MALTHRVADGSRVLSQSLPLAVENGARPTAQPGAKPLEHGANVPVGDEADVLAPRLVGCDQREGARGLPYLLLGQLGQRKGQLRQHLSGYLEQEVALIPLAVPS